MALTVVGSLLLLYGLAMWGKGWAYTLKPDGILARRQQPKNLKRGFTTDMKVFGRKIRRLGFLIALGGGALLGWQNAERGPTTTSPTTTSPTTTPPTTTSPASGSSSTTAPTAVAPAP